MDFKIKLRDCFQKDWFISLCILGVFLITNRYIFAWDDQHLEIPLLKHLIDPTLYQGDYYVESLTKNFTSYLYPILSRIITVDQIPAAYLFLFILARYFMFYWWLKLWHLLAVRLGVGTSQSWDSKMAAVCCVVYAIVLGRTEEFLYRTFSHQEFSLAIVFAAVYFFYKDRFILAAMLFGIAANIHALYALFPMIYMSVYLLFFHRERRVEYWFKTGFTFFIFCLPFLWWTVSKVLHARAGADPSMFDGWIQLYLLACPQNFPFAAQPLEKVLGDLGIFFKEMRPYFVLAILYAFNFFVNEKFRFERKAHAIGLCSAVLIATCFYFAYVSPNRFMLDLNLIRNEQFLRFFLLGYLVISSFRLIQFKNLWWAFFAGIIIVLAGRIDFFGLVPVSFCVGLMIFIKSFNPSWKSARLWMISFAFCLFAAAILGWQKMDWKELGGLRLINYRVLLLIPMTYALTAFLKTYFINNTQLSFPPPFSVIPTKVGIHIGGKLQRVSRRVWIPAFAGMTHTKKSIYKTDFSQNTKRFRWALIILPIVYMIGYYGYYHYQYVQITTKGGGFWQMQRNWEDMQRYVKYNTPKDVLIMTPYNMEMGGFRIQSERKILVSYRDCGIIGFDYQAAKEWQRRINDINPFKVFADPQSIGPAIVSALFKYKVDYIVFMRYYAPGDNPVVTKIYENEIFALYKVILKR